MKISIVIPFCGGIQFLEDCFESIKEQSVDNYEIILVCDHINENIDELLNAYACLKIQRIDLTDKTGVAAARNTGMEKATGDYIYFLDSDDYLYSGVLEAFNKTLENVQADIIYGKKVSTWFKRSIFLSTYIVNDEDENTSEDENDNVEDSRDESKDNIEEIETLAEEFTEENTELKAYKRLVTKRRGFKNISVLNILFKRSLLEGNNIKFNEELIFYCDMPFLIKSLDMAESYEESIEALYIKRKHNDPINYPALSQIKGVDRFNEYLYAYTDAVKQVPMESELRKILDKKLINYYANSYAKKLRRSSNDYWREERFLMMRDVFRTIDKGTFKSYKFYSYKRKLINALLEGNVKKALRIVNFKLARRKLRKMVKNRALLGKSIYIHVFMKMSIKPNYIVFESFLGKNYSDSCKYIYEYLYKNYSDKYKFIWAFSDRKKRDIPGNPIRVKRFSLSYVYYMARSKYWVNNMRQPVWIRKREEQVFLETWHGTPLKKLVFDMEEVYSASPLYKADFYKQSRKWDYLVSDNPFSTEVFKRAFMFDNEILEYGYPRNDIMHYDNREEIALNLRKRLGIPTNKKTILYAPTWRDDEFYAKGEYKFALKLDLHRMKRELGDEYVILLRTHYFIADALDVTGLEDFAFNLSKYDDISEIYLISDILITDYSSVFFDYANLKRPILFYTYDLEKYRDVLRGFYIDIEKDVPGPLLFDNDDIINAIKNIDNINDEYKVRYKEFYDRFCSLDDGHAAERVAKKVFEL